MKRVIGERWPVAGGPLGASNLPAMPYNPARPFDIQANRIHKHSSYRIAA